MANKSNAVNVSAASEVSSIQITINLGKPTQEPVVTTSRAPQGMFLRQVVMEPGNNPVKKIRTSFIPDDLAEDTTVQVADPDPGEFSKWKQLLENKVPEAEIDAGDIMMRVSEEGGTITWLPDDLNRAPVIHRYKQKTTEEPNGASVGDFITCWLEKGETAAAAVNCWSKL
jgi:hypothetical protein